MTIKNPIDWISLYNNPSPIHAYLTPRQRGKTDGKAQLFLEGVYSNKKDIDGNPVLYCWLRRRWHDSLDCTKPLFETNVQQFCEDKKVNPNDFEVKERGVWYRGLQRIYFVDLFSFQKKRGAVAKVRFEELVFDEAMPIDQEFLRLGEKDERWIFHDLLRSLKRKNGNIKITFLANDYFWSAWWLDTFDEDSGKLFQIKNDALKLRANDDNAGILKIVSWQDIEKNEAKKVDWLLYVNLVEGEYDAQSASFEEKINPFKRNWDDFMIPLVNKSGNLKKYHIEHAIQDYFFCELGEREKNKQFFFMHWTKNKKEVDSELINYCWDLSEKAKSRFKNCVIRDKPEWMARWVNILKEGNLFFIDFRARDWFIDQLRGK